MEDEEYTEQNNGDEFDDNSADEEVEEEDMGIPDVDPENYE